MLYLIKPLPDLDLVRKVKEGMARIIRELGEDEGGLSWVVEVNDDVPPFVIFSVLPKERPSSPCLVATCTVKVETKDRAKGGDIYIPNRKMRKRGIGTLLLKLILQCMKQKGISRIHGDLVPEDPNDLDWLKGFYEKWGASVEIYAVKDPRRLKDPSTLGHVEWKLR